MHLCCFLQLVRIQEPHQMRCGMHPKTSTTGLQSSIHVKQGIVKLVDLQPEHVKVMVNGVGLEYHAQVSWHRKWIDSRIMSVINAFEGVYRYYVDIKGCSNPVAIQAWADQNQTLQNLASNSTPDSAQPPTGVCSTQTRCTSCTLMPFCHTK